MRKKNLFRGMSVFILIAVMAAVPFSAGATHSWGNYHWARTSNPFTLTVVDSMTTNWDDNLTKAMTDWDKSTVMNLVRETGSEASTTRRRCPAVAGKVRACNANYGLNGWLGLAQIWASGSHITQGTAKMNDSYLASSSYSETNRQHVICQEIGHDWGLGHQDESGADLNTCMDYSKNLDNPSPDQHDYDQLLTIYSHPDSTTTIAAMPPGFANADVHAMENWGEKVSDNGRTALFVRDFGNDLKIFTFVIWATE